MCSAESHGRVSGGEGHTLLLWYPTKDKERGPRTLRLAPGALGGAPREQPPRTPARATLTTQVGTPTMKEDGHKTRVSDRKARSGGTSEEDKKGHAGHPQTNLKSQEPDG